MKHNRLRQASWHRYDGPGTYLITLAVDGRALLLGRLDDLCIPAIVLSDPGKRIRDDELQKIRHFYPMIHVWAYCCTAAGTGGGQGCKSKRGTRGQGCKTKRAARMNRRKQSSHGAGRVSAMVSTKKELQEACNS